jgi:hypothetical protein
VVVLFRRPLDFTARLDRRLGWSSSARGAQEVQQGTYHELAAGWRIEVRLHGRLGVEGLVGNRVPSLVLLGVYEALLLEEELRASAGLPGAGGRGGAHPRICDGVLVVRVCGAHEMVVCDEGFGGQLLEDGGALVAEQLGLDGGFGGRALDLLAVSGGRGSGGQRLRPSGHARPSPCT